MISEPLRPETDNVQSFKNINMEINKEIKETSMQGIINILSGHDHVKLFGDESREELEQILQLNINDGLIDEIELILELSGE